MGLLTSIPNSRINFHFGSYLKKIQYNLPPGFFCPDVSISHHSLGPFISNFIFGHKYDNLLNTVFLTNSLLSQSYFLKQFKYCPQCTFEDRVNFGETFWRRNFAVSHWGVCHLHGCYLNEIPVNPFAKGLTQRLHTAEKLLPRVSKVLMATHDEIQISKRIAALVDGSSQFSMQKFNDDVRERNLVQRGAFTRQFISGRESFRRSLRSSLQGLAATRPSLSYERLCSRQKFRIFDPVHLILTEYYIQTRNIEFAVPLVKLKIIPDCSCGESAYLLKVFKKNRGRSSQYRIIYCERCEFTYLVNDISNKIEILDHGKFDITSVSELNGQGFKLHQVAALTKLSGNKVRIIRNRKYKRGYIQNYLAKRDAMREEFKRLSLEHHKVRDKAQQWLSKNDREWLHTQPSHVNHARQGWQRVTMVIPPELYTEAAILRTMEIPRFLNANYMKNYFGLRLKGVNKKIKVEFYKTQAETLLDYLKRTSISYIKNHLREFGTLRSLPIASALKSFGRSKHLSAKENAEFVNFIIITCSNLEGLVPSQEHFELTNGELKLVNNSS